MVILVFVSIQKPYFLNNKDAEVGASGIDSIQEDEDGYVFDFPYDVLGDFPALRKPKLTF